MHQCTINTLYKNIMNQNIFQPIFAPFNIYEFFVY